MSKIYWIGNAASHVGEFNTAANWSSASVPVSGDSVWIDQNSAADLAAYDAHLVVLDELHLTAANTKAVGDAAAKLKICAALVAIGETPAGGQNYVGSGRLNLDLGTTAATITVYSTAFSNTDAGKEPLRLICNNASTHLNVLAGTVGVATDVLDDEATLGELDVTGRTAAVNCAAGVTVDDIYQTAGTLRMNGGCDLFTQQGGSSTWSGVGDITTATIAGTMTLNMRSASGATIGTLEILSGGVVDLSGNTAAITLTTVKIHPGGKLIFNKAVGLSAVTFTNPVQVVNGDTLTAA